MAHAAMIADRRAFIIANTAIKPVPHTPEIRLHVAYEATELWHKTEEELGVLGLDPPFWAFAWAGGQALARYVLDHPAVVAGQRVMDFAAGSGLVAIAAAKAGASLATAVDIDPFCAAAIQLNAEANDVTIEGLVADASGLGGAFDVILAGDVCYQRDMTDRVMAFLAPRAAAGTLVLIGDPGRTYLPKDRLEKLAEYSVPVTRELEDSEIRRTAVWRLVG